jgi:arylformamidase
MQASAAAKCVAALLSGALLVLPGHAAAQSLRERLAQRRTTASHATPLPVGARVERDIAYGPDPAQRMDVYLPPQAEHAPVIFMVHGGGWMFGDKDSSGVVGEKAAHWLPAGYIVISTNYRLSPSANPLEQADDIAKALAFAQSKASRWGADPARFVLVGHSAGAHLVSLLSADPSIATHQGVRPWLGTVSLDSAAYNVVELMQSHHLGLYDRVFQADQDLWREASPALRLKRAPIPMLLVCSSRRSDSCPQAEAFAAKAIALGGRATVLPVNKTHGEINQQLGTAGSYTDAVDSFLRTTGLK